MPVQKFSAMDPSGSWNMDARDQTAMWNADRGDRINMWQTNRMDQRSQDDWRKEVALQQIAQGDRFYQGNREDSAAARQAAAEAQKMQFSYMTGRDALGDKRWNTEFEQNRLNQEEQRKWQNEIRARDVEEYNARQPLQNAQLEMTLAQLARMKKEQEAMTGASGAASYTPTNDKGKEAYQSTLAMTGNQMQAGFAAKMAEREAAKQDAEATGTQVKASLQDFSAKDKGLFSFDPTDQDKQAVAAKVQAYASLLKQAGLNDTQIQAAIDEMLRSTLTDGGRTDINAGWSEGLLKQFNTSFR